MPQDVQDCHLLHFKMQQECILLAILAACLLQLSRHWSDIVAVNIDSSGSSRKCRGLGLGGSIKCHMLLIQCSIASMSVHYQNWVTYAMQSNYAYEETANEENAGHATGAGIQLSLPQWDPPVLNNEGQGLLMHLNFVGQQEASVVVLAQQLHQVYAICVNLMTTLHFCSATESAQGESV